MNYIFDVLPLLLLFVIFFMAFSFVETVILLAIKYYLRKYWVIFVDNLMRGVTFHRNLMRLLAIGSLALLLAFLVLFTPIFDILVGSDEVIKILAIALIVEMILIYLFSNREIAETVIEKRIHLYTFTLFSLIAYTSIMMMANQSYADYRQAVNKNLVYPVVQTIERSYEQRMEDRIMNAMHEKIKAGECEPVDYGLREIGPGVIQFAHIRDDLSLLGLGVVDGLPAPEDALPRGTLCVQETHFLFTPDGKWYQVIESEAEGD
jgi:hypothetical protein